MLSREAAIARLRLVLMTMHAWLALVGFDLILFAGFARAHDVLRAYRPKPATRSMPDPGSVLGHTQPWEPIVWSVDEACVWYVKRVPCLQRSAVTTYLLRRRGIDAALVIGCRTIPFESHAWVEVDGRVVNDRQAYRTRFTVLERL